MCIIAIVGLMRWFCMYLFYRYIFFSIMYSVINDRINKFISYESIWRRQVAQNYDEHRDIAFKVENAHPKTRLMQL